MYNPLAEVNLGGNIALALVTTPERELSEHRSRHLEGGGIYALYYLGDSPPYEAYRQINLGRDGERRAVAPIYIGSSFAVGIRSGLQGVRGNVGDNRALGSRITNHQGKINRTGLSTFPLDQNDFLYRALPLHQSHISLAEAALITFFRPALNGSGFGNHLPGAGRPGLEALSQEFNVLHITARAEANEQVVQRTRARVQERIREQVAYIRHPDDNADIERFMSLIRLKLGIA